MQRNSAAAPRLASTAVSAPMLTRLAGAPTAKGKRRGALDVTAARP